MAHKKSIGLPGGPNEYLKDITQYISVDGYKANSPDVNNPFNIIESGDITMEGVDFPVYGRDNLGNEQIMTPGGNYQFPGDQVFEVPMAAAGGSLPKAQRGIIKALAKKGAPYIDDAASYIKSLFKSSDDVIKQTDEVVEETPNAMSFFSDTPKQLNRPPAEDYIFYRNTSNPETIMEPLDFVNPREYANWKAPQNLSFFTPKNYAFSDYGAEKWGAKINPKNPFIEQQPRTYSVENVQKLIDDGFDAIITQNNNGADIRDAYQVIPLDKTIISNLEKMKRMGGRVMQDGGESFLYKLEKMVNAGLNDVNNRAQNFADLGEENSQDNLRHAVGGRYTAEELGQIVKDVPYIGGVLDAIGIDKAAGFIGANTLGLGHELRTFFGGDDRPFLAKLQEMGEDVFNNYVGSIVGSLDMSSDEKDEALKYLSFNNLLPDGFVRTEEGKQGGQSENVYFKDEEGNVKTPEYKRGGGLLNQTMSCNSCGWEWKAADGGSDIDTCHKCGSKALPKAQYAGAIQLDEVDITKPKATLSQYDEPGFLENLADMLANPMTSFGYSATNRDIPDRLNVNNPDRNIFDSVIDMVNPFAWAQYAENANQNVKEGEYLDATFDALGAIPIVPAWASKGKNLKGPIKETIKKVLKKGEDLLKPADEMVEVFTSDGTKKLIKKSEAVRLNRIEDANVNNKSFGNYEDGNWFSDSVKPFYLNNAKNTLKGGILNPADPKRVISAYLDPADARLFDITQGGTERALTMSGGTGNLPVRGEYVLPPDLVKLMRDGISGPGYNSMIGNSESIMKNLDAFYKRLGGSTLPKAQNAGETTEESINEDAPIMLDEVEITAKKDGFDWKNLVNNVFNPLYMADNALQVLGTPANLIRESIEGISGKGDGKFDWGNIVPDVFSTTILDDDDKQKSVSQTLDVDSFWGGLALDMVTDPTSYLGAGIVKNIVQKGGRKAIPAMMKNLKKPIKKAIRKNIPRTVKTPVAGTDMVVKTNSKVGELFDKTGIPKLFWPKGYNYGPDIDGKRFVAQATNESGDIIDLSKYTDDVGDYFSFDNAFVKNPMTAGRTMKAMESSIPKFGVIKQNPLSGSLSEDSFSLMLQRLKDQKRFKDVTNYGESTYLNRRGTRRTIEDGPASNLFKDRGLFDANEVKALELKYGKIFEGLQKKGLLNDEFRGLGIRGVKLPGLADEVYQVGVPNLGVQKLFQEGGGISPDILYKQAFVESSLDPAASNAKGYKGLGQIGDDVIEDYKKATGVEEVDPFDPKQNSDVQKWSMNELYNSSFINKENQLDSVRLAKTLASYNWGRGNVRNLLNELKEEGVDIYNSTEWTSRLPKETMEYIDMILNNADTETRPDIQQNFIKANTQEEYKKYKDLYIMQDGGEGFEPWYSPSVIPEFAPVNEVDKYIGPYRNDYVPVEGEYGYDPSKKVDTKPKSRTYTVEAGDNLTRIAEKYETTVEEIVSLNDIDDPSQININQEIVLPESKTKFAIYNVKSGDTLGRIAQTFGTSTRKLKEANDIRDINKIDVNQKLKIPQESYEQLDEIKESWIDVDLLDQERININDGSDEDIIKKSQLINDPNAPYVIVNKKTKRLEVWRGGKSILDFEVLTGANEGDAQTVTKMWDLNGDGIITDEDKRNGKWIPNWAAGNKNTGAGKFYINASYEDSPNKYGGKGVPSFNLFTDGTDIDVATAIHGPTRGRKGLFDDGDLENNKASNGCVNGKCTDMQALYDLDLPKGTSVYILPEDEGNKFQWVDGEAVMRMSGDNRQKYGSSYTDSKGNKQTGQGGNYSVNTLNYKAIRPIFNRELFEKEIFNEQGVGDYFTSDSSDLEEFTSTTQPFINALVTNKQKIMSTASIPSDVYNDIARIAFGIYGNESKFGDTHSGSGNLLRGANKKIADMNKKGELPIIGSTSMFPSVTSSPDVYKKYDGYSLNNITTAEPFYEINARGNDNSVGLTQLRWSNVVNEGLSNEEIIAGKESELLKQFHEFDIKSNKDLLDPEKSAIATVLRLAFLSNNRKGVDRNNLFETLPRHWGGSSSDGGKTYTDNVIKNAKYLKFQQLDKYLPGFKVGGEKQDLEMYKGYMDGKYDGTDKEAQAKNLYDKLNRLHYNDAKTLGNMSPPNYIMTHLYKP